MTSRKLNQIALLLALSLIATGAASADDKTAAKIKKIWVVATRTPEIEPGPGVELTRFKSREWVQIDVAFEATSASKEDFVNTLEIRFFVLPKGAVPAYIKLFTTVIKHVDILKKTELHSAVYLSPSALQRIYAKSAYSTPNPRDLWVAVEIHAGGKMIAWDATDGKSAKEKWWRRTDVPKDTSTLRPRHKTPYGLFWIDAYAEVRE